MGEGVSVVLLIFRVHAAGFSRDVMANQRNVAAPSRIEDIGFAGDESSSGGQGNVSWKIGANVLLLFLLQYLLLYLSLYSLLYL